MLKAVKIDESLFFEKKYKREIIINGQWYIEDITMRQKETLLYL